MLPTGGLSLARLGSGSPTILRPCLPLEGASRGDSDAQAAILQADRVTGLVLRAISKRRTCAWQYDSTTGRVIVEIRAVPAFGLGTFLASYRALTQSSTATCRNPFR